jgi:6-phosphogluconolactonase
MLSPQIIDIVSNPTSLAERAVEEFIRLAEKEISTGRRFTVALAGGSTPLLMYSRLSKVLINWDRIHFFWGDERCLPPENEENNYHMAFETLLKSIPIPSENIHRIHGELPVEQAAQNYEDDLHRLFGRATPRFTLVLLGLGSDGHTASLFPGKRSEGDISHWVAPVIHRVPPPPLVDRITLTLPVLNAAANVLFLVSGLQKAKILRRVLDESIKPELFPAQAVIPVDGTLHWLIDQDASSMLPPHLRQ